MKKSRIFALLAAVAMGLGWSILSAKSWFKLAAFFSKREQAGLRAGTISKKNQQKS